MDGTAIAPDPLNNGGPAKPQPPAMPDPADCCGSGCVRCIFDLHDDAMQRHRSALAAWEEHDSDRKKESGDA